MKFENIRVKYSGKEILKGVSFEIPRGKLTALIGRNGCGKSTLLGCLNGQTKYKGTVLVSGEDIKKLSQRERAKRFSLLSQMLPQLYFTVEELVMLGRRPYLGLAGKVGSEDKEAVEQALIAVKMTELRERPVNRLSGGERQRAFLACVIAQDADVIVLDEATTFMDAAFEIETYAILRTLIEEKGKTVLSVMHNLTKAVSEADMIAVMDNGAISAFGTAETIVQSGVIEKVFGVQKAVYRLESGEGILYL